jgi:predicted nucleic acid-binding protein
MLETAVLDASAWLAVLLNEAGCDAMGSLLENLSLLAPELIKYEAVNAVLFAKKSKKANILKISLSGFFTIIWEFPIQIVRPEIWWDQAKYLVQNHDLTFYDAAYLGLAVALETPIITLDKKIISAAHAEKVLVL